MRLLLLMAATLVLIGAEILWLQSYLAQAASQPEEIVGGVSLILATLLASIGIAAGFYRIRGWKTVLAISVLSTVALLLVSYAVLTRW